MFVGRKPTAFWSYICLSSWIW